MKQFKKIELTDTLPDDIVMQIGKYLIAEKLGTYSDKIYARITDSEGGYYIICGIYQCDYEKDKEKFDAMEDIYFKIHCDSNNGKYDAGLVILEAGDFPKFDRRIICGREYLSFEQIWNVINILQPYIIKSKFA